MILKRQQVSDILADNLSELRFPLAEVPMLTAGEVVPVSSSLYIEPRCWIRIKGWDRDGDDMVVRFVRAARPREMTRSFLASNGRTSSKPGRVDLHPVGTDMEVRERVGQAIALCDEPEMVSKAISDKIAKDARGHHDLRYRAAIEQARDARRDFEPEQRIADIERRAKQQHVNVSGDLHVIRQMLARAKAGGRRLDAVKVRLAAVEARLDGMSEAA